MKICKLCSREFSGTGKSIFCSSNCRVNYHRKSTIESMKSVYVMHSSTTNLVKVGITMEIQSRVRSIASSSGLNDITVKFISEKISNARGVEISCHNALSNRKAGEWFSIPVDVAVKIVSDIVSRNGKVDVSDDSEFSDNSGVDLCELIYATTESGLTDELKYEFLKDNKYASEEIKSNLLSSIIENQYGVRVDASDIVKVGISFFDYAYMNLFVHGAIATKSNGRYFVISPIGMEECKKSVIDENSIYTFFS